METNQRTPLSNGSRGADLPGEISGVSTSLAQLNALPRLLTRHILDSRHFSRKWLEEVLFLRAASLQSTPRELLPRPMAGKGLCSLLYEQSTSTRISFEAAMTLLGGRTAALESQGTRSREESLEDSIRLISGYGYDFILLRHFEASGAKRAAAVSEASIINCGDGNSEDPTQALVDLYTLWREFGSIDNLSFAVVGDLRHERASNSIVEALALFQNIELYFVSPKALAIGDQLRSFLQARNVRFQEVADINEVVELVDVIYMSKAMSQRFAYAQRIHGDRGGFSINRGLMQRLSAHSVVLHPLPRGSELPAELDDDPRIACFRQAENGLFVRMALLWSLDEERNFSR